jgi:hypothetical protein
LDHRKRQEMPERPEAPGPGTPEWWVWWWNEWFAACLRAGGWAVCRPGGTPSAAEAPVLQDCLERFLGYRD